MKVYRMNENDFVLHNSFDEAVEYYDKTTGMFEECKDEDTGQEFDIDKFIIKVTDDNEEFLGKMTVKEAAEKGLVGVPDLFSYEY